MVSYPPSNNGSNGRNKRPRLSDRTNSSTASGGALDGGESGGGGGGGRSSLSSSLTTLSFPATKRIKTSSERIERRSWIRHPVTSLSDLLNRYINPPAPFAPQARLGSRMNRSNQIGSGELSRRAEEETDRKGKAKLLNGNSVNENRSSYQEIGSSSSLGQSVQSIQQLNLANRGTNLRTKSLVPGASLAFSPHASSFGLQSTSSAKAPPPHVSSKRSNLTTSAEERFALERQYNWDSAIAKAGGKPVPPPPEGLMSLRRPPRSSSSSPSGLSHPRVGSSQQYKRRVPMGAARHKEEVKKWTQARINQLLEERYKEEQAMGFGGNFESYKSREELKRRVEKLRDDLEPTRSVRLSTASASKVPAGGLLKDSLSTSPHSPQRMNGHSNTPTSLHHIFKNWRTTLDSPKPPRPDVHYYEKLQRDLEAIGKEAEARLKKARRFPLKLMVDDQKLVDQVFKTSGVISTTLGAEVTDKDIHKLRRQQWLNDEVITFYAVMLNNRSNRVLASGTQKEKEEILNSHTFNSFFYTKLTGRDGYAGVKRWTRKIDLFAKDVVIIPINVGNSHWVCAAINIAKKRFEYYDSLGSENYTVYNNLRAYLTEEYKDKKKGNLDLSEWIDYWDDSVPQQENGSDCGVFTCQFMECLSRNVDGFDFDQAQMLYFRDKMVLEIKRQDIILEPWK